MIKVYWTCAFRTESLHTGVFVWFFCSVKMPLAAEVHNRKGKRWQFWTRIWSKLEMLSDILLLLKDFPLQPSLCYNILSLLWAKWLAGQQQPFFLAGMNVPRSWHAAHTMWLVLLLLKTGWKYIPCSGAHCCSCC